MLIIHYKIQYYVLENMKIKFVKRIKEWLRNKSCHDNKYYLCF